MGYDGHTSEHETMVVFLEYNTFFSSVCLQLFKNISGGSITQDTVSKQSGQPTLDCVEISVKWCDGNLLNILGNYQV